MLHSNATINHRLESFVYANAGARTGASGFITDDLGKIAFQTDTGIYYRLLTTAPTWLPLVSNNGVVYVSVPASPTATGNQGERAVDTTNKFIYECIAANTWVRYSYISLFGTVALTYVSNGDTNGLLYLAGTNYGASSWTNPVTAGYVSLAGYSSGGTLQTAGTGAADRVATDDVNIAVNAAGNYWKLSLPAGKSIKPNAIWIRARPAGVGTGSNVASYKIQGSNDDSTWTDIYTVTGLTYTVENEYKYNSFTAPSTSYRYIRLLWQSNVTSANSFFFLTDLELYGTLTLP